MSRDREKLVDVKEAVASRRSVRGFLDTPVDTALVERIAVEAARAPSGGNLQPWHVDIVAGAPMAALKSTMRERLAVGPGAGALEPAEYPIYPGKLDGPYRDRRFGVGEAMYAHIGIGREDRDARRGWFARNYQFFGAPVALFVTVGRGMGSAQWSDLGMFMQTFMLLATGEGLGTCAQECWAMFPQTIGAFLDVPAERMLFCGMAIGYEDGDDPANRLRSERAPTGEWLRVLG